MLQDIQALIAAIQAKDWVTALRLAFKIASEVLTLFIGGSKLASAPRPGTPTYATLGEALSALQSEAAGSQHVGTLWTIIQQVITFLLTLIGGGSVNIGTLPTP